MKFLLRKLAAASTIGEAAILAGGLVKSIPAPVNYSRGDAHPRQPASPPPTTPVPA